MVLRRLVGLGEETTREELEEEIAEVREKVRADPELLARWIRQQLNIQSTDDSDTDDGDDGDAGGDDNALPVSRTLH
jgi:hypothetical protein